MRKIPTMFVRDGKFVVEQIEEGCEWVAADQGIATRKWDGTACLIHNGRYCKRMEWSASKGPAPDAWLHHDFNPEQRSGHGWYPVGPGPEDWMHRLATLPTVDGSYELCGPKLGKNPEGLTEYVLIPHGKEVLEGVPRTHAGLRQWLTENAMEGIVWWHSDGRMAKIKRRDFGIPWPAVLR